MPSSAHKVLMYRAAIIVSFDLILIRQLPEEATEARNKDFRRYRQHLPENAAGKLQFKTFSTIF